MQFIRRYRFPLVGAALAVAIIGFLLFRPDKLFVDDVVDESLDDAFGTTVRPVDTTLPATTGAPDTTSPVTSTVAEPASTTEAPAETTTTVPTEPVVAATGQFYGIDHSAEGTATVYEQNGQYVLRFEDDTDIQNGPDLYVWLVEGDDYEGGTPESYIDLGTIKGNVGGQNYALPADYDPDVHGAVLIWCLRFAVPFAAAPLA